MYKQFKVYIHAKHTHVILIVVQLMINTLYWNCVQLWVRRLHAVEAIIMLVDEFSEFIQCGGSKYN